MARELTSTQHTNVEAGATRPIYLVEWQHSGLTEYLSCSGTVQYGDGSPVQTYTAGGLTIAGIEDSKTATIVLPATSTRVAEIQNNTWRLGICKITAILAAPTDTPIYTSADGLLVLDGVIESTSFSGETITVVAKSKYYTGALVPRFTYDDVVTSAPAVGTVSTWEGENYSYEQWLKTTAAIQKIVRPGVNPQVTGRQSVSQINSFEPIENTGQKLLTAQGVSIPVVYGRASVAGHVFAEGEFSGDKFIGVAWCMGEVFSIERVFINDAPVPSTVTAKHYRGTTTQTVSPALQSYINSSPQFSDDMVLRTPAGNIGICYSVIRIPASAISGAPRFRAIIQGRIVDDPASTAVDPFESSTEWSFNFLTGTTDAGPNNYTLTLNGNAGITSPSTGLLLDGTGDYATIPDGTNIGPSPFTLELEVMCNTAVTSPGTRETLISKGSTASPLSLSFKIDRVGDSILLYMSSNGSTWDIASGLSCGTLATTGSPRVIGRILVERVDNQISTYMNGVTQSGVVTSSALFNSSAAWSIGASGGADEFNGTVRSARLTIGQYRYGSPHSITNTPFSDSGTYTAGVVYSENPALCWADLATDPVIGLGATTAGVQLAAEYCDSALDSGAPRCRIGLAITEPRLVEAWLDQLAMYANAIWFPEGANLKIISDRSQADGLSGSGKELYAPTSPQFGSPLPVITTEAGVEYSISFRIDTAATTSPLVGVAVNFGGVQVIAEKMTVGTHGVRVTASGTSNTIQVIPNAGFNGTWSGLSVKRTHRSVTQWLPSTLSIQGMPEGDKPNAVEATYNIPDTESGAWKQNTFPVINAAAAGGEPIVLTKMALPGVNRIEEASNKAIATLYRNDKKTRVSLISTDEEFVAQPGDTIQVTSSYRGVNAPVFVESNRMVTYGRHQITGTIYRDNQYPSKDYTTPRKFDLTGPPEEDVGGGFVEFCTYICSAFESEFDSQIISGGQSLPLWNPAGTFAWPFATDATTGQTLFRSYVAYISAPNIRNTWDGSGTGAGVRTATLSSWAYDEQIGYCQTPAYAVNLKESASPNAILIPSAMVTNEDYTAVVIFTGYNGGTTFDHEIIRNSGKFYRIYRSGPTSLGTQSVTARVRVDSNGSGGAQVNITAGDSTGEQTASVDLGDISGQWSLMTVTMTNTAELYSTGFPRMGFSLGVTVSVSVTTAAGVTSTATATGYNRNFYAQAVTSIAEETHTLYTQPRFFYDTTSDSISTAFMGYGSGVGLDLTRLKRAFLSNFASYTGGEWCTWLPP